MQVNVSVPAQLWVDDAPKGNAGPANPLNLPNLRLGTHRVIVRAEGYREQTRILDLARGQWTQLTIELEPTPQRQEVALALTSDQRRKIQERLARLGFEAGRPDGVIGGATRGAIRGFQQSVDLEPSGYATAPTLEALKTRIEELDESERRERLTARLPFEPDMVALPGGTFWMGSPGDEPDRDEDEGPRHRVTIKPFAIGKTEVTFAQYDAFAEATGSAKPDDEALGRGERPVINVSWDDVAPYTRWLSEQTGKRYRLPSEAEWEYAARGGTESPFWTGACIDTDQANYDGDSDYNAELLTFGS